MAGEKRSAYDEAIRYLNYRMRTVSELRKHLREKSYESREIEEVIEELIEIEYLDDRYYAMVYFERAYEKKHASSRAKRELKEKDISQDTIEEGLADYLRENPISESELAKEIVLRRAKELWDSGEREFSDKEQGRIARKLANWGYSAGDIYNALGEARTYVGELRSSDNEQDE